MWIDSHCHLNHEKIREAGTPSDIVERAQQAGVLGMLTICCRIASEFSEVLDIARAHDGVWCSIGTHPHDAGAPAERDISSSQIVRLIKENSEVIGIGETGLDYYYNHSSPEDQAVSFSKHIQAALESDLPVIIHSRDAETDTARILREEGSGVLRGVMHCFSPGPKLAEDALHLGFYISFSGIVTFKKSEALREIARTVPLDRVLVETDAPYLAPDPFRGKLNEPAYVAYTGNFLAELYGLSPEEFARITTENFYRLFSRAKI
jgi:TatD DNase family protein